MTDIEERDGKHINGTGMRRTPAADFRGWLEFSRPGDTVVYFNGFLARDVTKDKEARIIRAEAMTAYMDGIIDLVQYKLDNYEYEYWAIKKTMKKVEVRRLLHATKYLAKNIE